MEEEDEEKEDEEEEVKEEGNDEARMKTRKMDEADVERRGGKHCQGRC